MLPVYVSYNSKTETSFVPFRQRWSTMTFANIFFSPNNRITEAIIYCNIFEQATTAFVNLKKLRISFSPFSVGIRVESYLTILIPLFFQ